MQYKEKGQNGLELQINRGERMINKWSSGYSLAYLEVKEWRKNDLLVDSYRFVHIILISQEETL